MTPLSRKNTYQVMQITAFRAILARKLTNNGTKVMKILNKLLLFLCFPNIGHGFIMPENQ